MTIENIVKKIGRLIACPSISNPNPEWDHGNKEIIDILADWFSDFGFTIQIQTVDAGRQKYNLIATIGNQSPDQGIIFSGHTDTVAFNRAAWHSNPFQIQENSGKIYGLGTTDMKSFFAVLHECLTEQKNAIKHSGKNITFVASAEEETSMAGMRAIVAEKKISGHLAIIGEPTNMIPVALHKGIFMMKYILTGHGGHSSDPNNGRSALEGMYEFIGYLLDWRSRHQQNQDPRFSVPFPTLNLGQIQGGDSANRICTDCSLTIDCRLLPGFSNASIRQEFAQALQKVADSRHLTWGSESLFPGVDALATNPNLPEAQWLKRITGQDIQSVNYGTEGPFFQEMGIPAVILGPGSITQAHSPNEFIELSQLQRGYEVFSRIIKEYLTN